MTIGILGLGHMGSALLEGFLNADSPYSHELAIYTRNAEILDGYASRYPVTPVQSASELAEKCDLIILAVSAPAILAVLAEIKPMLKPETLIVSVGSKVTLQQMYDVTQSAHLTRIIPNIPVRTNSGISLLSSADHEANIQKITDVFSTLGTVYPIPEEKLEVGSVITGCSPAFYALFIEALADGAVKYGLSREEAYALAIASASSTGDYLSAQQITPSTLKDQVASPGGTTIKGIAALEEHGLRNSVIQALDAICKPQ